MTTPEAESPAEPRTCEARKPSGENPSMDTLCGALVVEGPCRTVAKQRAEDGEYEEEWTVCGHGGDQHHKNYPNHYPTHCKADDTCIDYDGYQCENGHPA